MMSNNEGVDHTTYAFLVYDMDPFLTNHVIFN